MSGFEYMVHGNLADVRMKLLAHITMNKCMGLGEGKVVEPEKRMESTD